MAETFPGEFEYIDVDLQHTIFSSKSRGGFTTEVRVADPYWGGELTTLALERAEYAVWDTFLGEVIDRQLAVDFVHPLFPFPRSYALAASVPGTGTGTVTGFPDGRTITVSALPVGLILKKGDRFSLEQGDRVLHYRVAEDVTVSTTVDQAIKISPRMRTGLFTATATFRYLYPKLRLRVSPNTVRAPLRGGSAVVINFNVYEDGR